MALWLGMAGVSGAELTPAQQRGLQLALEEFHKHPPVQWAFQEMGVDSAMDTVRRLAPWGSGEMGALGGQKVPGKWVQNCLGYLSTWLCREGPPTPSAARYTVCTCVFLQACM